jgi:hypothetical protein
MHSLWNSRPSERPVFCRTLRSLAVLVVSLCLSVVLLVCMYRFHPDGRWELKSPAGNHRAFVESIGFLDPGRMLEVSDWPWTFSQPFCVADLVDWPEVYRNNSSHWTNDGSAIVFVAQAKEDAAPEVKAGYDFSEHFGWKEWPGNGGSAWSDRAEQTRWLAERGGLGPDLGYQDLKGDEGEDSLKCPWWVWALPVGVLLGGGCLMDRIVQKTILATQKGPLIPS